MKPENIADTLLSWWDINGRHDLPWQREPTPYRVWVSEIMLQQTQVATVLKYYDRFMLRFPSLADLATADIDEVLHLWTGLGYYSRARNLHKAAQLAHSELRALPENFDGLLALPGIGRSTAGAILSLASNQRYSILDGNAKRVLARVFAVGGWPGNTAVANRLWELADACTPQHRVNNYTQAIMDLGASLCSRRNPRCESCPLHLGCDAFIAGAVHDYPGKKPKRDKPQKHAVLAMLTDNAGCVLLEKRPPQGIWGGLYSFPEFASVTEAERWCAELTGGVAQQSRTWAVVKHGFSHYDFHMQPLKLVVSSVAGKVMDADRWLWYNTAAPAEVGLAAPVKKLLESFGEPA
ncbi:MAG: A/G-specific adenine glycosylase [Chromatiales bacterium]|nr:A/G-specific adenine glycosylase [Chromatiales bacterium]